MIFLFRASEVKCDKSEVKCDKVDCCNWQRGVCMALSQGFEEECPFYKTKEDNEKQLKRLEEKRK